MSKYISVVSLFSRPSTEPTLNVGETSWFHAKEKKVTRGGNGA